MIFLNYINPIIRNQGEDIFMINAEGKIIANQKTSLIGSKLKQDFYIQGSLNKDEGYSVENINGQKLMVIFSTEQLSKYKIIYTIPQKLVVAEIDQVKYLALRVSGFCIIISIIISFIFSNNIYRPILDLKLGMEEVGKGNFDIRIEKDRKDEFGILNEGFNDMTSQVNQLIQQVYIQKIQKKEAELNALQSQITPHFLYNTLNSIRCAAVLQNATNVSDMLGALIELLQLSAGQNKDFITLQEEIQQVKNYVALQMFRYRDLFQVNYDIDENLLIHEVPKLILQPFIIHRI
jgi:two-component system sensor histidine kinase YesM